MSIISKVKFVLGNKIKYRIYKKKWRRRNPHNYTIISNLFDINKVKVGQYTYGGLCVHDFNNPEEGLQIGSFCSIGAKVEFFLGGEHHPNYVSNYPFKLYIKESSVSDIEDRRTKGKIVIDDDVWIGANAIILSGVHIGQGAIVGAGTVVAKDIPPYAIYVGGRIVKKRFSDEIIEILLRIDYNKLAGQYIKEHIDLFYTDNIENVIKNFLEEGIIDANAF